MHSLSYKQVYRTTPETRTPHLMRTLSYPYIGYPERRDSTMLHTTLFTTCTVYLDVQYHLLVIHVTKKLLSIGITINEMTQLLQYHDICAHSIS